jgi:hypothetical protein
MSAFQQGRLPMPDDPVIRRIRETRRRIQEECGNDIHKMYL